MAQIGKAAAKRSKPSYFMAILGVTIVLFFVGIFGWLLLNAKRYSEELREGVKVQIYLRNNITPTDIEGMKNYLATKPYTKSLEFIDKEAAKKKLIADEGQDFSELLDENPLPNSFDLNLKAEYVQKDTIAAIKADLEKQNMVVESVKYPAFIVEKMGSTVRVGLTVFAILAGIFCILSIVLIDNTIRLAMYSNRFLIKTMQMVGATRGFISRPMNVRAIINGTISALIAIGVIYGLMVLSERFLPYLKDLRDNSKLIILFLFLLVLGISISLFSTWRSVVKYLKMKLDELY
ncbi:ABC transporter permease [Pseudoflavitalea sp. G-6-1-2]|uniref:cell division protein FtsX n=1 Tax=Pseudoflavitalea sp. G-6-1-2 TaxID=2728841 RepID=UPI00146C5189|nr:permease-like cell division protein FtsX [Pseudoflavitalea sp. G-6-1-2]NML20530.1 ABC transporter permease [Pseudoflavitalea sp. G-6-1-2]